MTQAIKWMSELYSRQIDTNLVDGSNTFKNYINDAKSFPFARQLAFINLKYQLSMETSGYTYTTFRSIVKDKSVIYAVAYFRDNEPKFLALSPSYDSSRGEFRDSFIEYSALEYVFSKYSKQLEPLEEQVLKAINNTKLDIQINFFPQSKAVHKDLHMLGVRLMAASIYLIIYKKEKAVVQQHIHRVFIDTIKTITKINDYKIEDDKIYKYLFQSGFERPYGQKITPLPVGSALHINDISYSAWREIFISYAASDMVLNGISPTFPVSLEWSYLEGSTIDMYDNTIIKNKYAQNKDVIVTLDRLKDIYRAMDDMTGMYDARERVLQNIQYITSHKLLSNISISMINEFIGLTATSITPNIRNAEVPAPNYHRIVTELEYFDKFIFELFYGLYVLHKKVGIIHSDTHMNNISIMCLDRSFYKLQGDKYIYAKDKKYMTAFIVDQQQETYLFQYDGYYSGVLDFSDAWISKKFLDYTSRFVSGINFEDMIDHEKDVIFDKLSRTLSYANKHKDEVKAAIVGQYDEMFKAISAIDYVSIARNLKIMFEKEWTRPLMEGEKRKFYVDPKIIDRLEYIENESLELLLSSIQNVIENKKSEVKFAGETLLRKFFKKYLYDATRHQDELYEVYNYNADWRSSCASMEEYPQWSKKTVVEEKFGRETANQLFGTKNITLDDSRDIHLSFLIESLAANYSMDIEQRSVSHE